ncbi:hypothetical protein GCM10009601_49730 [Streptomyces thermospinosisporus]|uniref:Tetratricopeptide repeat protein n=1 Tax=Streptomyces thermospinosisporus TaxID=161482 RepID=A0ABP4JV36_9ACTN
MPDSFPGLRQCASAPVGSAPGLPAFGGDAQTARHWYDRESRVLQAAVRLGQQHEFHRLASYLARNTVLHLHAQGAFRDFRELAQIAVAAARRAADAQALCLSLALASAHQILGEFQSATEAAEEGLRVARSHGDTVSEAAFLDLVGWAHIVLGRLSEGYDLLLSGIALHRELGACRRESIALCNLSTLLL